MNIQKNLPFTVFTDLPFNDIQYIFRAYERLPNKCIQIF